MQTKTQSMIEVISNIGSGFIIGLLLNFYMLPLWGFTPSIGYSLQISLVYTVVSIIRSYIFRRLFNKWHSQ